MKLPGLALEFAARCSELVSTSSSITIREAIDKTLFKFLLSASDRTNRQMAMLRVVAAAIAAAAAW